MFTDLRNICNNMFKATTGAHKSGVEAAESHRRANVVKPTDESRIEDKSWNPPQSNIGELKWLYTQAIV